MWPRAPASSAGARMFARAMECVGLSVCQEARGHGPSGRAPGAARPTSANSPYRPWRGSRADPEQETSRTDLQVMAELLEASGAVKVIRFDGPGMTWNDTNKTGPVEQPPQRLGAQTRDGHRTHQRKRKRT